MSVGLKTVLGQRKRDDGFTYSYGKFKFSKNTNRNKTSIDRQRRADKKKINRIDDKIYFDN